MRGYGPLSTDGWVAIQTMRRLDEDSMFGEILTCIMGAMIVGVAFFAGSALLGLMIDGMGTYQEQHERCLKSATNGYEIEKCR